MAILEIDGVLEIDEGRGVIYFHTTNPAMADKFGGTTILRICSLPKPIKTTTMIDVTHMVGTNWSIPNGNKS